MPRMQELPDQLQQKRIHENFEQLIYEKNFFLPFMGRSDTSVIKQIDFKGTGLTMEVPTLLPLNKANVVGPDQQILGTEQRQVMGINSIELQELATAVEFPTGQMYEQATPLNLMSQHVERFSSSLSEAIAGKVVKAFTRDIYPDNRTGPSQYRSVYAGKDHGADDKISTNIADVEGFTFNHLLRLIKTARQGLGGGRSTFHIGPTTSFSSDSTRARFGLVLLLSSDSWMNLRQDEEFKQYIHSSRADNRRPDGITGSSWQGQIEGVDIYQCPNLDQIQVDRNNTVSWDLLLGREALVYAMPPGSNNTSFSMKIEKHDYERRTNIAAFGHIGISPMLLPYNGKKLEMGIIHSFSAK